MWAHGKVEVVFGEGMNDDTNCVVHGFWSFEDATCGWLHCNNYLTTQKLKFLSITSINLYKILGICTYVLNYFDWNMLFSLAGLISCRTWIFKNDLTFQIKTTNMLFSLLGLIFM